MEFKVFEFAQGDIVYRIEEDYPEIGVYLYVIENGRCIQDYLQNSIEMCKCFAFKEHGVPMNSWNLIDGDDKSLQRN